MAQAEQRKTHIMTGPSRLAIAALSLGAIAACEPAANDYDTFIDKCLPVAQMSRLYLLMHHPL